MSGREAAPLTPLGEASDTLLVAGGEGAEAGAENLALVDWGRQRATQSSSLFAVRAGEGGGTVCASQARGRSR
jgi:hypothetical protein